jgi:DMSO/TMAO reductase YedYZ heme-binding membrane subunit
MTSTRKNLLVFAITFVAVALPSFLNIQQHAYGEEAFDLVLRLTARAAILVYLVIFVARPLVQLTGSALSRTLLRYRRQAGVAFAAIMLAHLLYLVWKHGFIFPAFGAVIYVFIILMLITSFDGPTRALGPKRWKVLHKTGLYVVGIALAQAQFGRIIRGVGEPVHYVLASLFVVAVIIRVLAWNKRRPSKN